jgi:transcriptional regulator with XRE-family HTH domain/tetratricopeptide (TPR) repeat protein
MSDRFHIGKRVRHYRQRRRMRAEALGGLLGHSASWVRMVERGEIAAEDLSTLLDLTGALGVDLGTFLTAPAAGISDTDQAEILLALQRAFGAQDSRAALSELAGRLGHQDARDLVLIVEPGSLTLVNRRDLGRYGAVVAISLTAGSRLDPAGTGEVVAAIRAGRISPAGVRRLRASLAIWRHLDDELGPAPIRPVVDGQRRLVGALRNATQTSEVAGQLGSVAAELDQFAGWLAFDLGDFKAASARYRTALETADAVDDQAMAAHILGCMSLLAGATGTPLEAIRRAEVAVGRAVRTGSHRLVAAVASRKAKAHAQANEADACRAMLDLARAELAKEPAEADPPYVYYLDQSQLDVLEGGCYVMLEDPAAALPVLRRALAARPPTFLRSRTGLLVCMAISLLDAGEVVEATRVGGEAADLLAFTRSRQVRGRLGELQHRLYRHRDVREARALAERLAAL